MAGPAIWNWLSDSLRYPAISKEVFTEDVFIFSLLMYTVH